MTILFVSDEIAPYHEGGAGVSTELLARALAQAGHRVVVLAAVRQRALHRQHERIAGVERCYRAYGVPSRLRHVIGLWNPRAVADLGELIRSYRPDVLHFHNVSGAFSFAAVLAGRRIMRRCGLAGPVYFTARDALSICYGKLAWYGSLEEADRYRTSVARLLRQARSRYLPVRTTLIRSILNRSCTRVFAVSASLAEALQVNGIQQVEVAHNPVDTALFARVSAAECAAFAERYQLGGRRVVLAVGRLSGAKGAEELLQIVAQLLPRYPKLLLLTAARFGLREQYATLIDKLGLRDHIRETGWLAQSEMPAAYAAAEIVCVPSVYLDPFPRACIEAMAAARPVLGTLHGGAQEALSHGVHGYLVDPKNTQEAAAFLDKLLSNPEQARALGHAGYTRVGECFTPQTAAERMLACYSHDRETS